MHQACLSSQCHVRLILLFSTCKPRSLSLADSTHLLLQQPLLSCKKPVLLKVSPQVSQRILLFPHVNQQAHSAKPELSLTCGSGHFIGSYAAVGKPQTNHFCVSLSCAQIPCCPHVQTNKPHSSAPTCYQSKSLMVHMKLMKPIENLSCVTLRLCTCTSILAVPTRQACSYKPHACSLHFPVTIVTILSICTSFHAQTPIAQTNLFGGPFIGCIYTSISLSTCEPASPSTQATVSTHLLQQLPLVLQIPICSYAGVHNTEITSLMYVYVKKLPSLVRLRIRNLRTSASVFCREPTSMFLCVPQGIRI